MNRRAFITGLITSVSGCSAYGLSPPTEQNSQSRYPQLQIERVHSPSEATVDFGVEIESGFTDESPATVRLRVTNTGNSSLTYVHGPSLPYPPAVGTSNAGDAKMYLVPEDETGIASDTSLIPKKPTEGCWRATSETFPVYEMTASRSLQPGDAVTGTYVLLSSPENDPCLPASEYTFSASPVIDERTYEWQFDVAIKS